MTMTAKRLAELDAAVANDTRGVMTLLYKNWPYLRAHIEAQDATIARLRRCLLPVQMLMAQAECVDEPLSDSAVVLSFMGSGASDQVTAGEVRAALAGAA